MSANPKGWCSHRECPCWTHKVSRACSEFMGYDKRLCRKQGDRAVYDKNDMETWGFRYCDRCGWERADHKPLIHKGGKP